MKEVKCREISSQDMQQCVAILESSKDDITLTNICYCNSFSGPLLAFGCFMLQEMIYYTYYVVCDIVSEAREANKDIH